MLCAREQRNWSSRGQNQRSEAISALTDSSARFYFLYYPFIIFHIFATNLLPSLLTSWFGKPPATSCHDMPRLGPCWQGGSPPTYKMEAGLTISSHLRQPAFSAFLGLGNLLPHLATATTGPLLAWVSIKWRGLTPHLHHKQGWISIKWRGLTPHLLTLLLCGREQRIWISRGQNQRSEAISALTLLQSSTSSTGLGNLLPHLATTCHDWALAGRVGLYKMEGSNPPPAP